MKWLILVSLLLVGCGETSTYAQNEPIFEPTQLPQNTSDVVIVQGGSYVDANGDYVVIYCEGGNCNTYLGIEENVEGNVSE